MKLTVYVGCESCSCGSIETHVIEVDESIGQVNIDYECNNCESKTALSVAPYKEGDEIIDNEEEDDANE